jgi:hypothetical protein
LALEMETSPPAPMDVGEPPPPAQPESSSSSPISYQRSLLLDCPELFRAGGGDDSAAAATAAVAAEATSKSEPEALEDVDKALTQRDRNRLAKGCAKCGRPMEEWQKTWARNGEYSGLRYHKKCRNRPFPASLRQLNINMAGNRMFTGETESEEEQPPPDNGDEEEEEDKPPPPVEEIPQGMRWNKFQGYYKGQAAGVAADKFREYQILWAKAAVRDAEGRGEVPIFESCLLPRGLKWPEFCSYFAAHPVELRQQRWERYLAQGERLLTNQGDPLGGDEAELVGQHVLVEDKMERGVIVKADNGLFTVRLAKAVVAAGGQPQQPPPPQPPQQPQHREEDEEEVVVRGGYELYLADSEEHIRTALPSGPSLRPRAPPRPQPKKPRAGTDVADILWGQKKRGAPEWDMSKAYARKRSLLAEDRETLGSSASLIVRVTLCENSDSRRHSLSFLFAGADHFLCG